MTMAGIGFELRKLYREEGLVQNVRAYVYSSLTTIGPMILCLILMFVEQLMMKANNSSYLENELFIATMVYCFIFSIIITSGFSMIVTRYIADMIYQKMYEKIISSFYGILTVVLPIAGLIAAIFLHGVQEDIGYKIVAYLFFIELVMIWLQNVFLSALKDYKRIVRGFTIGIIISIVVSFLLFKFLSIDPTINTLAGIDVGFAVIVGMSMYHFERVFPRDEKRYYFAFLSYLKKYPSIFFSGLFVYSGVYIHNFVYWIFSDRHFTIANHFVWMPFYDVPVFYAYISVLPSLVMFVVVVETDFYVKFLNYYRNVVDGGTYESMNNAKKKMQNVLLQRITFLVEVQLLFTTLCIALGIIYLPKIGFTMEQLDLFILLCLAYFFFIILFVILHVLMYFDDRKGVLSISGSFILLNIILTFGSMKLNFDGTGMFFASFLILILSMARLLYVLKNIDYYTFCSQPLTTMNRKERKKLPSLKSKSMVSIVILSMILLSACGNSEQRDKKTIDAEQTTNVAVETSNNNDKLEDDKRLYERDEDHSIKSLYITIVPDQSEKVDWYALNRMTDRYSKEKLDIIFAEGTEDGIGPKKGKFGYDTEEPNAKISIRGNSSRSAAQKSYKIKLFDNAGLWQEQRTIDLNKHIDDPSRLRNKLSFDLMEDIPHMTSLRTQFVHLYVKDLTDGEKKKYEDYGLYTQIEQPNKKFLRTHLLDTNGYLYKVTFFEFDRYPEQIRKHTDPKYDQQKFESILEIKGKEDHDKLISMLDDVNNFNMPIEDVIEKHFDVDNLLTWTAMNILMDNMDTDANNFYLYSPLNSEKWFILPWDYDGGWELQRKLKSIRPYQAGISNYWGNKLLNRYFRSEKNVQKLSNKVEELSKVINKNTVSTQISQYKDIVKPFILKSPDKNYLPIENAKYEEDIKLITSTPERAKKRYYLDLQKPKPFYMGDVEQTSTKLLFTWDVSFDLQGDDLYYTITVAKDPYMKKIIAMKKDIRANKFIMKKPAEGPYFWKVTVRDRKGHQQSSFDMYTDEEGNEFHGIRDFEVD